MSTDIWKMLRWGGSGGFCYFHSRTHGWGRLVLPLWIKLCLKWWLSCWGSLGPWGLPPMGETGARGNAQGDEDAPSSTTSAALLQSLSHILRLCTWCLKIVFQGVRHKQKPGFKFTFRVVTERTAGLSGDSVVLPRYNTCSYSGGHHVWYLYWRPRDTETSKSLL